MCLTDIFKFFLSFLHKELTSIQLDDNRIKSIEQRAFMNLNKLKYLTLRGNKLEAIADEAFQVFFLPFLPIIICSILISNSDFN